MSAVRATWKNGQVVLGDPVAWPEGLRLVIEPEPPSAETSSRIVKTPGVCGGDARIDGTRISVWGLEEWRRLGWSDAKIFDAYPQLKPEDLAAAWAYVAHHRDEIETAIRENQGARDDTSMTAEEIARTLTAMESGEPFDMTEEERAALEAERRARKEWEKAHFTERAEKLRGMWE